MTPPILATVPRNDGLIIRVSHSGVMALKKRSRFLTRYTGNKHSAVDINGGLWLNSGELKAAIKYQALEAAVRRKGGEYAVQLWEQKRASVETQPGKNLRKYPVQKYGNLSTQQPATDAVPDKFSPKLPREYRIKKKEVRQRLLGYLNTQAGKKELYFWTVTFPEKTPDDLIYKIFNVWLTSLRQYKMLRQYLWVAERQKNGTVHFHIAIPHKMSVQRANAMMRGTLKRYAKSGELPFSVYACNRYNGVDIAKNRATKRVTNFAIKKGSRALAHYLTKYVTKNEGVFPHLAWHNSRGYSSLFLGITMTLPEFEKFGFHLLVNEWKTYESDFFTFVPWAGDPPTVIMKELYTVNSYLQYCLN